MAAQWVELDTLSLIRNGIVIVRPGYLRKRGVQALVVAGGLERGGETRKHAFQVSDELDGMDLQYQVTL